MGTGIAVSVRAAKEVVIYDVGIHKTYAQAKESGGIYSFSVAGMDGNLNSGAISMVISAVLTALHSIDMSNEVRFVLIDDVGGVIDIS